MEIFGIIVLASLIGLYLFYQEKKKMLDTLKILNEKRQGKLVPGLISYPRWSFPHLDTTIVVSALNGDRGPFTYVQFHSGAFDEQHTYELEGRNVATKLLRTTRKIGIDKDFDALFHLHSDNDAFVLRVFDKGLRQKLQTIGKKYPLEIQCSYKDRCRFMLSVQKIVTQKEDVEELVAISIFIYERMMNSL
ncbi:hypothetical protein [Candidatus Uabimicrobium amorphum]|uniref:Uncharacterized protein n=1 Tax=Uabimicrobium amorphum TaxID=2596890 RepID=A0A5S9ILL6_UABAM|nr:hypothetical protein [Candidatus Uabimicrobium amorphum]BBM84148.1 hypothetical protein UABAM_02504 [Candidatus Uabimicrobium amorphum]